MIWKSLNAKRLLSEYSGTSTTGMANLSTTVIDFWVSQGCSDRLSSHHSLNFCFYSWTFCTLLKYKVSILSWNIFHTALFLNMVKRNEIKQKLLIRRYLLFQMLSYDPYAGQVRLTLNERQHWRNTLCFFL